MSDYDVIVAGAGLAGATAANLLANRGLDVLLVEKRGHIAGNCFDDKNAHGITVQRYGPHIFHTNDAEVWRFVTGFGRFHPYEHRVLSRVDGRFVPFPINLDTVNAIFGLNLDETGLKAFFRAEVERSTFRQPAENFRDVVVSQVGERLYELFFKNYTIKQWQQDPEKLAPEVAQRIPVRFDRDDRYFQDKFQGIPAAGFTKLVEQMLDHPRVTVRLGQDYFDLKDRPFAGVTVYTGKLDAFFGCRYGELGYRSVALRFEDLDREYYQPAAVVNYPNEHDWTRITEFKYFLDEKAGKTTVLYEYPQAEGEPFYVTMTEDNIRKRDCYRREAEKLEATGKYLFLGRLAEYRYYNMDQVIMVTMERIRTWSKRYGICTGTHQG
jgi:UDP-galactopyranose mutase